MEYIFIFTYSVILAVMAGGILGAIVALFSKQHKGRNFRVTFCYSAVVVVIFIMLRIWFKLA